jgi:hypothetical protein
MMSAVHVAVVHRFASSQLDYDHQEIRKKAPHGKRFQQRSDK